MRFLQTNEAVSLGYMRPGFAVLCHLGNSAVSLSQDQRVATTDDSIGVGAGGAGSKDSGNAATAGFLSTAQSVRDDAVLISGSGNKFGSEVTNSGTLTITNNATGVENVTKTFAETVKELVATRPSTPNGAPLATDDKKTEDKPTDTKSNVLAWVGGIVAFLVVGEVLRRLFLSKAKKS